MCRDEDHVASDGAAPICQGSDEVEAAVDPEVDVHEDDVRLELFGALKPLAGCHGEAHHADPLPLQEGARSLHEEGVVVDDEAAQGHSSLSIALAPRAHIEARMN